MRQSGLEIDSKTITFITFAPAPTWWRLWAWYGCWMMKIWIKLCMKEVRYRHVATTFRKCALETGNLILKQNETMKILNPQAHNVHQMVKEGQAILNPLVQNVLLSLRQHKTPLFANLELSIDSSPYEISGCSTTTQ